MEFLRENGTAPSFLKVREGCYVRVRDISVIGLGMTTEDGETLTETDTVVVHMANGSFASFDPCESRAQALEVTDKLVLAVEAAELRERQATATQVIW
jgi:hypothetical protein